MGLELKIIYLSLSFVSLVKFSFENFISKPILMKEQISFVVPGHFLKLSGWKYDGFVKIRVIKQVKVMLVNGYAASIIQRR